MNREANLEQKLKELDDDQEWPDCCMTIFEERLMRQFLSYCLRIQEAWIHRTPQQLLLESVQLPK